MEEVTCPHCQLPVDFALGHRVMTDGTYHEGCYMEIVEEGQVSGHYIIVSNKPPGGYNPERFHTHKTLEEARKEALRLSQMDSRAKIRIYQQVAEYWTEINPVTCSMEYKN